MTATLSGHETSEYNWRSKSACKSGGDYDLHFADVEVLVEDEGMSRADAEAFVEMAEATAKAICGGCPVVDQCRDWALTNDEKWGIWGGMNASEREVHRPLWLEIKGLQGAAVEPIVVRDQDALRPTAGASAKLAQRNERARVGRDMLLQLPTDWGTPKTRKDKARSRDDYLAACELILANPTSSNTEIMARQGLNREYLATAMRTLKLALDLP